MDTISYLLGKKAGGGGSTPVLQDKEIEITQNGETTVSADSGYDGLSSVEVTTNVPQPSGTISITENGTHDVTNYATANVNVSGSVNIPPTARFAYSKFTDGSFLSSVDFSSQTDFSHMFYNSRMETMPIINTSNGTDFSDMFSNSYIRTINQLDTSNANNMFCILTGCANLTTLSQLDCSKVNNIYNAFLSTSRLTTLGGFKNLGNGYLTTSSANNSNYTLYLNHSPLLTHDSLMNVINNLYDIATAGVQTQKLVLGSTNLAKLSAEEIAIATNKGWTVS